MEDSSQKWEGAIIVPIDCVEPNPWNPQRMRDDKFSALVEEIRTSGFDEPLLVIRHPEKEGMYRIIGGEHRWKALKVLGHTTVPVVVKEGLDDLAQKTMTVRRNLLRGELDRVKFSELVNEVVKRHDIPIGELVAQMGITNEKEFSRLYLEDRKKADERVSEAVSEVKEKMQALDNLGYLLNDIFSKFGGTLSQGFIFFMYKGKMHLMIQMDKDMEEQVTMMVGMLKANGGNVNEFLSRVIGKEMAQMPPKAAPVEGSGDGVEY